MLAESLGDLPPLLLVRKTSEPTKYKGPSYNAGKFEKSPFQTPTNTTLEIYEEIPHIFQVTNALNEPFPPSSYNYINVKGEFSSLKERRKKFLNWDIIGIVSSNHTKQIVSCK
ncbi:hypothetical protein RhiirC2_784029 [Rhizophagus irregularis]|uniref:Uncharacterized protein n=1 Tax=Rhizophagus irregularis TaxID=588596 RepID=A0A2N1MZJ2_9GLOM|nr:hypothetical protein RhiirC2_784029 [Rhizophagus irregularis]